MSSGTIHLSHYIPTKVEVWQTFRCVNTHQQVWSHLWILHHKHLWLGLLLTCYQWPLATNSSTFLCSTYNVSHHWPQTSMTANTCYQWPLATNTVQHSAAHPMPVTTDHTCWCVITINTSCNKASWTEVTWGVITPLTWGVNCSQAWQWSQEMCEMTEHFWP